jgi:hypothetical protein
MLQLVLQLVLQVQLVLQALLMLLMQLVLLVQLVLQELLVLLVLLLLQLVLLAQCMYQLAWNATASELLKGTIFADAVHVLKASCNASARTPLKGTFLPAQCVYTNCLQRVCQGAAGRTNLAGAVLVHKLHAVRLPGSR